MTSDAGMLLLRQTDEAIGLTRRLAACFQDHRDQEKIEHRVETMMVQRVFGSALGYEDINDHDELRHDPASVAEAFHEKGCPFRESAWAPSGLLRANLLTAGPFVTALPSSTLHLGAGNRSLKALPVSLQIRGYPLAILTLKNRMLNPLVALFIDHLREIARLMPARP